MHTCQSLQYPHWINDEVVYSYAQLLLQDDPSAAHALLVEPLVASRLASAAITQRTDEVEWVKTNWIEKNNEKLVSCRIPSNSEDPAHTYILLFQGVWPAHWFLIVSEPLHDLRSISGEQTGDHWVVVHADLGSRTMTYWNSHYMEKSWKKWKDVSYIGLPVWLEN